MKNCNLCSVELKFLNTPTFNSGKLNDGTQICTACFKKVNKINPSIAFKLKNHSLHDLEDLISQNTERASLASGRLDEIKKHIQSLGLDNISTFFGRKEINELPNILAPDEKVDHIVQGSYSNGQGILVSTNRRLLFIDKGLLYGLKVEDFPLDKISSIQYETGLLLGKIKIYTSGNMATIENIEKKSTRSFCEFVRNKLSHPKTEPRENRPEINVLDQLEKLAKLKENGILSQEEFDEQKKKLLQKI